LRHAAAHPRITYLVASAEASGLREGSVDAVAVAQALHWFDFDKFYAEVRRVAKPDGVVVAWTYADPVMDDPALQALLHQYNSVTVGAYWPKERQHVREEYRTVPFPFARIAAPALSLSREWTLPELAGYLRSWSATSRYTSERGEDPVGAFETASAKVWRQEGARRTIRWPLTILAGRVRVT
jgi:SAM-dependent methyltransferase